MSSIFSAPLAEYNVPLPFFSDANAPLWHAAIGYEITGIIGILVVGGLVWGIASLLKRRSSTTPDSDDVPTVTRDLPAA
jgi:hypothetical protein